jgi:HEAT repeat protein
MRAVLGGLGLVIILTAAGCGEAPPTLVHGKPVADWVHALRAPDSRLRKRAVEALGSVGTADPAAMPALVEALRDREAKVRQAAVLCLLRLGPAAADAVPALDEVAKKDRDRRVRDYAASALEKIQASP